VTSVHATINRDLGKM